MSRLLSSAAFTDYGEVGNHIQNVSHNDIKSSATILNATFNGNLVLLLQRGCDCLLGLATVD